jgi:hypothetical protein
LHFEPEANNHCRLPGAVNPGDPKLWPDSKLLTLSSTVSLVPGAINFDTLSVIIAARKDGGAVALRHKPTARLTTATIAR